MAALTKSVSAPEVKKDKDVKKSAVSYPFWFGGSASCFATFFTHPLDLGMYTRHCCRYLHMQELRIANTWVYSEGPVTNTG